MKYLKQDIRNEFLEKKNEFIFDAAKLGEEQQTLLRNHFERNLFSQLEKCNCEAVKDTIQLLYNKGLFDSFVKADQLFNEYLTITVVKTNPCWKKTEQKHQIKHQKI